MGETGTDEGTARVTCHHCGSQADLASTRLTWSVAVEDGRRRRFCDRCSREHLRAAEGGLDSSWW